MNKTAMKQRMKISELMHKKVPLVGLVLSLTFFVLSMSGSSSVEDMDKVAEKTAARIEKRLAVLDKYILEALETGNGDLILSKGIPEDMVVYRYVNDSLQSWSNQFPVMNDDISSKMYFQRLTSLNRSIVSPLSDITEEYSYMNLGLKWYVVKAVKGWKNDKVIAGLEIKNTLIGNISVTDNGVNKRFRLPWKYSVIPLSHSGGTPVTINGIPMFKVLYDSGQLNPFFDNSMLRWAALAIFAAITLLFLIGHRTFRVYFSVVFTLGLLFLIAYLWGLQMSGSHSLFSPTVYADGPFFFSLGALLLTNTYIALTGFCTYLIKGRIAHTLTRNKKTKRAKLAAFTLLIAVIIAALCVYIHMSLSSLILNSNISLDLHRWNDGMLFTILVYISYTALLITIPMLQQLTRPAIREFTGKRLDFLARKQLIVFFLLTAAYFTVTSGMLGFRKEQDRVIVWANRLAVDRDLALELQLRGIEEDIASDQLIASLASLENTSGMILNRITEYYLNRSRQMYDVRLMIFHEGDNAAQAYLSSTLGNGVPIAPDSRFYFVDNGNGNTSYMGIFLYYQHSAGLIRMFLQLEPNSNKEDRGYYSIIGHFSKPGNISIPQQYSYAKYNKGRLSSYKGTYPYPNRYDIGFDSEGRDLAVTRIKKYTHFIKNISDDEMIVISRPTRNLMSFCMAFSHLFLIQLLLIMIFTSKRKQKKAAFKNNYFRTKINTILFVSSFLILASITTVSIIFVYQRNESNRLSIMATRITAVQTLLESRTRHTADWQELLSAEFASELDNIGNIIKADISLFTPSGKVFRSTAPEVFEKNILGSRIRKDAFYNIRNLSQRYYINKEKIADYTYWSLYAPLLNDRGELIAIISMPYTGRNYDFRQEALFHAAMLINMFIFLLIISLLFTTKEVNAMFAPLIQIGKKMNRTDIHNLEFIEYNRNDEISSLVDAYNLMVKDLANSTKQLAQAERDKAWSQMARQVAHEIKNPLTPIKLEIQRLIRLKQNNNPKWEEKFDQVAAVVLEHIDILSDTANEFSTFAKLYNEEPVLLDLDKTLKDQILIFDNKENVRISYIGMEHAYAMAPKPQLIRVFVNLITNALQAVEIQNRENSGDDCPPKLGKILICLRNSTKDGYYDIVFDDNGPGVKEENLGKLFTPNFTTKTSGTGLGLAICHNIMEKCEGGIRYQKSFALGGASFIVTIPKHSGKIG